MTELAGRFGSLSWCNMKHFPINLVAFSWILVVKRVLYPSKFILLLSWLSIQFALAVWFCSGQKLPAHPCHRLCMSRESSNNNHPIGFTEQNKAEIINVFNDISVVHITQDKGDWFKKEHQKTKSWLWRKEELGMKEGNLLLSKQRAAE